MNATVPAVRTAAADPAPGRICPLHYRYAPQDLTGDVPLCADTLYVAGGLYGNPCALDALLELAAGEPGTVKLIFNGDFNWFNIDAADFTAVNTAVLKHTALRGNVETEIAGDDETAGCGCAYPETVTGDEVARSNNILLRLRSTARRFPVLRRRIGALPMHGAAEVGGLRVAIVHGDADSLAGWGFAQDALNDAGRCARIATGFAAASARVFASSHTCLPVALDFATPSGTCALVNNGAAGMPNFSGTRHGVITRIAVTPARGNRLYGLRIGDVHVDAVALHYDHARWRTAFLANWPADSPGYASYYRRIVDGPAYTPA